MELDGYNVVEGESTAVYIHMGNKLGAIVAFNQEVDEEVGHEVAMQIAAMNLLLLILSAYQRMFLNKKQVAADKAREEGKPENLIERIAEGRINKFYSEVCLLKQAYVKDTSMTIAQF